MKSCHLLTNIGFLLPDLGMFDVGDYGLRYLMPLSTIFQLHVHSGGLKNIFDNGIFLFFQIFEKVYIF